MPEPRRLTYRPPRTYGRVNWIGITTVMRRHWSRFLKGGWETIGATIFSTLLYLAVFALALGPDRATEAGALVYAYIVPGLTLFAVLQRASEDTVFAIAFDRFEGIIADLLMPPLSPIELVVAYACIATLSCVAVGVPILLLTFRLFELSITNWPLALVYMALAACFMAAVGMIVGLWAQKWDHVGAFLGFVMVPMVFLSGTFTPISSLDLEVGGFGVQQLLWLSPFAHLIDGFRGATTGIHAVPIWTSFLVSLTSVVGMFALAAHLYRLGWRLKP